MQGDRRVVRNLIFRLSCSSRCRNFDVAWVLNTALEPGRHLLDVGCGESGLADFVRSANVVGTDILQPHPHRKPRMFVRADITALPFTDCSFPAVAAVDVLEHLPLHEREMALAEVVRVTQTIAVVAFPCGRQAEDADKAFQRSLSQQRKMSPSWLEEHLEGPYPSVASIVEMMTSASVKYHREIYTDVVYSENIRMTRMIRWAASRSVLVFFAIDLLAGLWVASRRRQLNEANSYRAIIVARFNPTTHLS